MEHPWNAIDLSDYESHMSLGSVLQLQTMNETMRDQFYRYPVKSVMILGIAGGNGLEHISRDKISRVYGVDINSKYLDACTKRYPGLKDIFHAIEADLSDPEVNLPKADIVIANLLVEYLGCDCFAGLIGRLRPAYLSCVIQMNEDGGFVSDSPYLRVFDCLEQIHCRIEKEALTACLEKVDYRLIFSTDKPLPNGKKLIRLDYKDNVRRP